ncbi:MAG: M23 family metallopeptidase [Spirochaetia bacterium]|nr:M23 family metallopeptidase [Spirochaetia bacterium]
MKSKSFSNFIYIALILIASYTYIYGVESITEKSGFQIQWPVETKKTFIISSTFGESRMDHFHNGVDIVGKGISVYPVLKGRVLWKTEATFRPGDIPFGGGKTVVIDHNGLWSGYMHLMQINPQIKNDPEVNVETSIGKSGDTGHSGGAHLHFFIYDPFNQKMLNPLPYLVSGVYQNNNPPVSTGYGIVIQNELLNINIDKSFRMSKDYPIYAKIIDSGVGREKWGIYTFESYADDEMKTAIQKLVFNYIVFQNNRWTTSNGKIFEDVYYENWLNMGTGFKKSKKIIWKAAGYLGPEAKETIELDIKD